MIGYVAISQVGVIVATRVANARRAAQGGLGSSAFANASLLFQMPYGIIGVALLTALLPRMSRAAARHDVAGVVDDLALGTRLSALGLLPVTAALIVLGPGRCASSPSPAATPPSPTRGGIGTALAIGRVRPAADGGHPAAAAGLLRDEGRAHADAHPGRHGRRPGAAAARWCRRSVEPQHVVAGLMLVTSVTYVVGWVIGDVALRAGWAPAHRARRSARWPAIAAVSVVAGVARAGSWCS